MPFSLGAHVGQQNMSMDAMRAAWRRLDAAGIDWLSCWDHLYEAPPAGGTLDHFEAIATLGAMCVETQRARLGNLVFYVGYRNPALLAKAAVTLDHLSGGRFELGLGGGWHDQEAIAYGYDFPSVGTRLAMLEEAVPLIRSLLSQERTTFQGRFFRTENASCLPRPVGGRHLPIWVGGKGEKRTLRIAARHADGWNAAYISPRHFARLNTTLDNWCDVEGRDPAVIERSINLAFMLATDDRSAAALEQRMAAEWGDRWAGVAAGALMGTPDRVVEQLAAYREAGAQGVNIALRAPWDEEALSAYLELLPTIRAELG